MEQIYYAYLDTPVGRLLLAGTARELRRIEFPRGGAGRKPERGWVEDPQHFTETARQLRDYFNGRLRKFDLPLNPEGTPFQQSVWRALRHIPYGATRSYGEIAAAIGKPRAVRAVGAANGRNPLPIVIPCHRVIGGDGSLTGFGGGLDVKRALLELEASHAGKSS